MAFEGNYTLSQLSPSSIELVDTSTGSDTNLTGRRIYLYQYNNTTIVPSNNPSGQAWIDWDINDTSITLDDILDTDYCLNVTVVWVSSSPQQGGTYIKNNAYCFKDYNEEFMLALVSETNVALPTIVNSNSYVYNWMQMRLYVEEANEAISNASDVMNGQLLLNLANNMRDNQNYYF